MIYKGLMALIKSVRMPLEFDKLMFRRPLIGLKSYPCYE